MKPRPAIEIYYWLLQSPRRGRAVGILEDDELCQVSGWLGRLYEEDEPTGEMLGLCLVEQAARFAGRLKTQDGKIQEGRREES